MKYAVNYVGASTSAVVVATREGEEEFHKRSRYVGFAYKEEDYTARLRF